MSEAAGEVTAHSHRPPKQETTDKAHVTANVNMRGLVGSKLRKKWTASVQEDVSAPASDFARKQLEKMGWTEGTGLGKKRDGITTHLRAIKREEQCGLGSEKEKHTAERKAFEEQWWKDSITGTLEKLQKKKQTKGDSKKRKKDFTDEELFEATGGARFGMRAAPTKNLAKWRRAESDNSDLSGAKVISPEDSADDCEEKLSFINSEPSLKIVKKKSEKPKKSKKEKKFSKRKNT